MFDRSTHTLAAVDPELWSSIQSENERQEQHIELIASENYASPAVMAAQGSQLIDLAQAGCRRRGSGWLERHGLGRARFGGSFERLIGKGRAGWRIRRGGRRQALRRTLPRPGPTGHPRSLQAFQSLQCRLVKSLAVFCCAAQN